MTTKRQQSNQQGSLLISAIILLIFIGFVTATIAYFSFSHRQSFTAFNDAQKAFNVAQTGLEKTKLLTANPPSGYTPITCGSINGQSDLTNIHILGGQFTVTSNNIKPLGGTGGVDLDGKLQKDDTTISVNNGSVFPDAGQIMIEHEKIQYKGKSGDDLLNATRGIEGTQAVDHKNNSPVTMLTCDIHVEGQYPASDWRSQRTINIKSSTANTWLVGETDGGDPLIAQWQGGSWTQHSSDFASDDDLQGIAKVAHNDLWAMGQDNSAAAIFYWDGSSWTQRSDGPSDDFQVNDIACPRHHTCFSVGNFAGTVQLHRFQSSNWNNASTDSDVPGVDYLSITCPINPNNVNKENCWAVGPAHDNSGQDQLTMIHYSSNSWSLNNENKTNNPIDGSETLHGVSCGTLGQCIAVGDSGVILNWDGSSWTKNSTASSITSNTLNDVYCLASGECWAAGNAGTILHLPSGGSWSDETSNTSNDLLAISCSSDKSCWAVGDNTTTDHFFNNTWTVESNSLPSSTLTGVADLSGSSDFFWDWELS